MSDIAIRVEGLGKRYRIGTSPQKYNTLRDTLVNNAVAPFRRAGALLRGRGRGQPDSRQTFWALKDVSFEIKRGEVVGVIGANGAGKTTLLKILSRITEPTEGYADVYGRVGSLLEVGTGFHPELTGRENIALNGAILGMRRREIERKFDEIVSFAEVERFIDTPVKRYSSGMYLRLAFAVAAHLEPDILLVDEVLAVGDAAFQKKCLGKMGDVAEAGRTVLFVSHNLGAIQRLCRHVILFDEGRVVRVGLSQRVVIDYLRMGQSDTLEQIWGDIEEAPGDDIVRLRSVRVKVKGDATLGQIDIRKSFEIEVAYWNLQPSETNVILIFSNGLGLELFTSANNHRPARKQPIGMIKSTCTVPGNFLAEGRIELTVSIGTFNPNIPHVVQANAVSFSIVDEALGDSVRGDFVNRWPGVVRPTLDWSTEVLE